MSDEGCSSAQFEPEGLVDLLNTSVEALDTDDELVDKSFDLDSSIKSDTIHYVSVLGKGETEAAELAGLMIMKCERTIRDWRSNFFENGCKVTESKQGGYQRAGVLWKNETLNKKKSSTVYSGKCLTSLLDLSVVGSTKNCFPMKR